MTSGPPEDPHPPDLPDPDHPPTGADPGPGEDPFRGSFPAWEGFGGDDDPLTVPTSQFTADPDDPERDRSETEPPRSGPAHRRGGAGASPTVFAHHPYRIAGAAFLLVVLVVLVGGYLWLNGEANPSGPKGAQVIVTVPKGAGVSSFSGTLAKDGVIGSSLAFRVWISIHGDPGVFTGSYAFNKNDSFATVKSVLANGPNVFDLEVLPGFTVSEVATRIGQFPGHSGAAFKALATGGTLHSPWQPAGVTSLDGLLGTGSYQLVPGESDTQLLTQMIDRFNAVANSLNLTGRSAALGLNPYQAITMASIVEKEGVIEKNLGPVARVILNRLAKNMPLQMDSTVLYSEGRDGGAVTSADLKLQTPYNTYLNNGLTPTPICFTSPAALQAALNPPAGSWLYFVVVDQDGTEAFADTYAQQLANQALATQRGLP
ncbi:MAG TPA: endolytic transglycosylase MltG [Acidimicrobiales bacterium]|nr:endolytic transglycosylase MltG [Acidimicrobiales bacterium]